MLQKKLEEENKKVRVVSMPSMELFRKQEDSYREEILPKEVKKVSIEMASTFGWSEFTGDDGLNIGIDRFGISGKGEEVQDELGFCVEKIKEKITNKFFK